MNGLHVQSLVNTPEGPKTLENLEAGDFIKVGEEFSRLTGKILQFASCLELRTDLGTCIIVPKDSDVPTKNGVVKASSLQAGDDLLFCTYRDVLKGASSDIFDTLRKAGIPNEYSLGVLSHVSKLDHIPNGDLVISCANKSTALEIPAFHSVHAPCPHTIKRNGKKNYTLTLHDTSHILEMIEGIGIDIFAGELLEVAFTSPVIRQSVVQPLLSESAIIGGEYLRFFIPEKFINLVFLHLMSAGIKARMEKTGLLVRLDYIHVLITRFGISGKNFIVQVDPFHRPAEDYSSIISVNEIGECPIYHLTVDNASMIPTAGIYACL